MAYSADVTAGLTYVSSSDESGSTPPSKAFDDSLADASEWRAGATEIGALANGVSYVGVNFGAGNEKEIRRISIRQGRNGAGSRYVTSVLFQSSSDGAAWTTRATINSLTAGDNNDKDIGASAAYQYWRFLANSAEQSGVDTWVVVEAEMKIILANVGSGLTTGLKLERLRLVA